MKFFGRELTFRKAPLPEAQTKAVPGTTVNQSSWWYRIFEPFTGAWQRNIEWNVSTVLSYPIVYSCITLIADDVGKLPPIVMRRDSDGIWVEYNNANLLRLLENPNHYQNHIQFKQFWVTSKLISGNTYCLKQRDAAGNVEALYIINPRNVQVLVTPNGEVWYQLSNDPLNEIDDVQITVPASEIIHDRMNCLFHPLVGISPLFAAGLAAQQGLNIQNDASYFFSNGARPSGILTAPGEISDEVAARLKAHWEANYSGQNAGKVAVLGDALKFEPLRMTFVDAQVIEQLKWLDLAICACFKVPPYKVGVGPMPSNNNVEAQNQEYYVQCLQIHIESMELCLDEGLSVPDGQGIALNLDVLLRMDTPTLIKTLGEGVKSALYSPNEARRKLNLPPVDGGASPMIQQQNYSLAALDKRDSREDPFSSEPAAVAAPERDSDAAETVTGAEPVQNTALNGAQVTALQGIITAVALGQLPIDTARNMILAAFPGISETLVDSMLTPLANFEPPTPEAPEPPAPNDEPAERDEKSMADMIKLLPLLLKEEFARESV